MDEERFRALEKRVLNAEEREQALLARTIVQGQVVESLLGLLFFEKGLVMEEAIKSTLRNATPDTGAGLSDQAAVWWSDSAVHLRQSLEGLLARVARLSEGLQRAEKDPPSE